MYLFYFYEVFPVRTLYTLQIKAKQNKTNQQLLTSTIITILKQSKFEIKCKTKKKQKKTRNKTSQI